MEEEDYCKPKKVDTFYSDNFTICERRGNENKTLSIEEYVHQVRPCLKDIIKDLEKKSCLENPVNNSN